MSSRLTIKSIKFVEDIFLLGVFLKQFYVFDSGSLQLGDLCFALAFVIGCLFRICKINKNDHYLIAFVSLTFIINGLYFFYYREGFLLSSVYLLFNLLIVILFRVLIKSWDFLKKFSNVLKLNLIVQVLIYFLGIGRYFSGLRYEGTFNDPNQFAYFVLMDFFLLYMTNLYLKKKINLIWYIIVILCLLLSMSSGMILAFGLFLVFTLLTPSFRKSDSTIVVLSIISGFLIILLIVYNLRFVLQFINEITDWQVINSIVLRLTGKLNQLSYDSNFSGFFVDRGMERVLSYPHYFLYGSGEGLHGRFFYMQQSQLEIHSSVIGLFFYYGFIPFLFLLTWVKKNLNQLPVELYGCFIALFVEALTLANHRQPFFWMSIVLGGFLSTELIKMFVKVKK